ncbi:exodeoxyribonuclease VII small subunit [Sulfuriroseicoccus oceanibius]|uniref:Exodeoxyribonuclease 7 small subunit n=1 Tax=Sulfuriroseicoccus oceanibius TaxID=2707525 RepID=A0A6B3L399_9BACT|nr:exodeoxyribonuclease VII small subunit [Sulfuriroseicoccus oceanibius]QQL45557.1 exodeoxyribonuclease VII small subunit [Sulfuriroseicoccus oceanibius]
MKFEQAFGELEALIGQMESDELPLDEMVQAYERGTRLWNQCKLRLDEARLKVEAITKASEEGELETDAFDAAAPTPAAKSPKPVQKPKPSEDDEIKLF